MVNFINQQIFIVLAFVFAACETSTTNYIVELSEMESNKENVPHNY